MLFKAGDKVRAINVPSLGNNTYTVLTVRRRGRYQDLLLSEGWNHSKLFEIENYYNGSGYEMIAKHIRAKK